MGGVVMDCKIAVELKGAWYELEVGEAFELYQRLSEIFSKETFKQTAQEEQIDAVKADTLMDRLRGR